MLETFLALLTAHVVADFLLQGRWILQHKREVKGFGAHTLIVAITATLALGAFGSGAGPAVAAVLLITITHIAIDSTKLWLARKPGFKDKPHGQLQLFLADQAAHVLSLVLVAAWLPQAWQQSFWASTLPHAQSLILTAFCLVSGFLITTRAGEFAIALFMRGLTHPSDPTATMTADTTDVAQANNPDPGLPQGGAWIGLLERSLIFMLILFGQFAAIGFLIAAKSVLRFQYARERSHSEIVIIGTLASFTWAIFFGWLTLKGLERLSW